MFLTKTFAIKSMTVCGVLFVSLAQTRLANAAELQEARVSQVIQDVRLLEAHAAPHAAAVNDKVIKGSAVRTGTQSRAELTFNDLTITRLGANTIFSFTAGTRQAELTQGAVLLQVRPGAPEVRANTTAVTVAVVGGTALLSAGPPTKFMVLEGTGTIYPLGHPEKAVTVRGGEMVIGEHGRTSKPEKFDVKLVLKTSPLVTDFAPLSNLPLIQTVMNDQVVEQQVAVTTSQPLIKNLINTINVTSQSADANPAVVDVRVQTPTPTPQPTPSKFGTPSTIALPNPYVITSGTFITTDPSITTNGVTDYGTIYRGPTDDGAFSLWAFGSTSAFDTALNIDTEFFADLNNLPIAVFKFQNLSLVGNPTIDLSNGGVTNLGLIGVDGITSGPPGGMLTFTGLDLLALATVNGSINLTSDVSFQNLNELAMYARGAGSDLTLNSPISNIGILELAAEGSIQLTNPGTMSVGEFEATAGNNLTLQIGGSLLLNGTVDLDALVLPGTTVASGANVTLNITGDYTNSSTTEGSQLGVINEGAHIGTGGNIDVNIGGDLTTGSAGEFSLVVHNTNGQIDNGGNITVATNGSISTGGEFNLLVENYNETANPAGQIGTGGNISLTTGGNFTADFASIALNNRGGGMIDSGVNLTIDIGGALTTIENGPDFVQNTASLSVAISSRYDDTAGNTQASAIGGDATLSLHADSASIGGILNVFVSNRGGSIGGNALLNFNVTHDVTVTGADIPNINDAAEIEILNDSGPQVNGADSPLGGTIHGDATLLVSTGNLSVPNGSLDVFIENPSRAVTGGTIDGNATVDLTASAISVAGGLNAEIENQRGMAATGSSGGSIGGNATLNITAASLSVGGELDTEINNFNSSPNSSGTGGDIGGSAALSLDVTGNISVTNDFIAYIQNQRATGTGLGPSGGSIGSDATLDITAGAVSVGGSLDVAILNRNNGSGSGAGGSIGGSSAISLNITGDLTAQGAATVHINNETIVGGTGGTIDGNATLDVSAANITTGVDSFGTSLDTSISNTLGNIGGNAIVNVSVTNDIIGQGGTASFQVLNSGGNIGGNAEVDVSAANITANSFTAQIDNSNGGSIGANTSGGATINMNVSGTATVSADATVAIYGSDGAVGGAAININSGSYDVGGTFLSYIDGNGTITFTNATAHADVLKAGVFGANGVLNVGGGILSADTELKLYASGSNGVINFLSNITLGGGALTKILAANTINIFDNVVVTIGGSTPVDVYTTNANYTGFGGNGTTTGTFAGAGANDPQPLANAPPFVSSPSSRPNGRSGNHGTGNRGIINVGNTEELLALLDGAAVGPDGRITVPASQRTRDLRHISRADINALRREARRILIQQTRDRSITRVANRRIL